MAELGRNFERESCGRGRYRSTISVKPVNYKRGGVWRRIGNTLGASGDPNFPVGVDELLQFRIRGKLAGQSPVLHFGKGQTHVRMTPLGTNNVDGVVDGQSITFPEAWPNADLRLTIAGHRLQKDVVLRMGHPQTFAFRIDAHAGLDVETLSTEDFRILQPVLHSPNGMDDIPLQWVVTEQGGKTILTVTLPEGDWAEWVLDPMLTLQPGAAAGLDTYLYSGNADGNYDTETGWAVGASNNYRECVKFNLSSIPPGSAVVSVTLSPWLYASSNAGNFAIHRILAANSVWGESTASWNNADKDVPTAWAGSVGCSTSGTDHSATALWSGDDGLVNGEHTFSLDTTEFEAMLAANHGFIYFDTGGAPARHRFYRSSDYVTAAERPKLVVVYSMRHTASGRTAASDRQAASGRGTASGRT